MSILRTSSVSLGNYSLGFGDRFSSDILGMKVFLVGICVVGPFSLAMRHKLNVKALTANFCYHRGLLNLVTVPVT